MQVQRLLEYLHKGTSQERKFADSVMKSQKFSFDVSKVPEHIRDAAYDFASQLLGSGIFPAPFDDCLFEFGPGEIGDLCSRFWVFVERRKIEEPPGWEAYIYAAMQIKRSLLTSASLVHTSPDVAKILMEPATPGDSAGSFQVHGIWDSEKHEKFMRKYQTNSVLKNAIADSGLSVDDFYTNLSFKMFSPAFSYLLTVLGLMSTKSGVTTTNFLPLRPHVDAKRVKQGKLPLGYEHKVITIDPSLLKMPGIVGAGGTHASPRMHWRRGHVRHYDDGRITSVRPAIVGDVSRGVITHDYAVRSGRQDRQEQPRGRAA